MHLRTRSGLALLLGLSLNCGATVAQERTNPFVPPPSEAEEAARMEERMRNIVLEMQPEIKKTVMQDVEASQASLEIKLRHRIEVEIEKVKTAFAASAAPGQEDGVSGTPAAAADTAQQTIPEGATFISCVNRKALYRDKDNTLFQVAGDGVPGSDRCAD